MMSRVDRMYESYKSAVIDGEAEVEAKNLNIDDIDGNGYEATMTRIGGWDEAEFEAVRVVGTMEAIEAFAEKGAWDVLEVEEW